MDLLLTHKGIVLLYSFLFLYSCIRLMETSTNKFFDIFIIFNLFLVFNFSSLLFTQKVGLSQICLFMFFILIGIINAEIYIRKKTNIIAILSSRRLLPFNLRVKYLVFNIKNGFHFDESVDLIMDILVDNRISSADRNVLLLWLLENSNYLMVNGLGLVVRQFIDTLNPCFIDRGGNMLISSLIKNNHRLDLVANDFKGLLDRCDLNVVGHNRWTPLMCLFNYNKSNNINMPVDFIVELINRSVSEARSHLTNNINHTKNSNMGVFVFSSENDIIYQTLLSSILSRNKSQNLNVPKQLITDLLKSEFLSPRSVIDLLGCNLSEGLYIDDETIFNCVMRFIEDTSVIIVFFDNIEINFTLDKHYLRIIASRAKEIAINWKNIPGVDLESTLHKIDIVLSYSTAVLLDHGGNKRASVKI